MKNKENSDEQAFSPTEIESAKKDVPEETLKKLSIFNLYD